MALAMRPSCQFKVFVIAQYLSELATVTLTEITETEITGTFSGTFLWYDVGGGTVQLVDSMVISEGMFAVPRF